jgi:predicted secreted protein
MALPHDFRAAARRPAPVNGVGEPLQISGDKLQKNFEYLDKLPSDASTGDMISFDGSKWVLLLNPGTPTSGYKWTLQHDSAVPVWVKYKEITVSICEDGTPTSYTILGIPTA